MAELDISPAARADLVEIDEYGVREFGQDIADGYSRGFGETFALLRRHPLAGPARPDLGRGIRCILHRKHRIFYTLDGDLVVIIRIIHHAQDARRALN